MGLSNTATPIYYGQFRDAVMNGDIPINREIAMEMNRIDDSSPILTSTMTIRLLKASSHIARMR